MEKWEHSSFTQTMFGVFIKFSPLCEGLPPVVYMPDKIDPVEINIQFPLI